MATAIDVLPLATVRDQLRIETDADDAVLTGMVNASVRFVGGVVSRNIIDKTELIRLSYPGKMRPLLIYGWDAQEPDMVSYYMTGDDLVLAPTRMIEPGRWLPGIRGAKSVSELWPPSGGWPDIETGSNFEITMTFGMDAGDVPEPWVQSAILVIRELYEGSGLDAIPQDSSIYRLLRPWTTWV